MDLSQYKGFLAQDKEFWWKENNVKFRSEQRNCNLKMSKCFAGSYNSLKFTGIVAKVKSSPFDPEEKIEIIKRSTKLRIVRAFGPTIFGKY